MKAKDRLRGLVGREGHPNKKHAVMHGTDQNAIETYMSIKDTLQETKMMLEEELRRMDDFQSIQNKLLANITSLSEQMRDKQVMVDGKPRRVEEELLSLNKEKLAIKAQVTQQNECLKALKNDITNLENELLRAEFYVRHIKIKDDKDLHEIGEEMREQKLLARMRVAEELKAGTKLEETEKQRAHLNKERIAEVENKIADQIRVAKESNKVALSRILDTSNERRKWTQLMVEAEELKHDNRVEAILQLKSKIDHNMLLLKGQNEKKRIRTQKQLDKLQRTKADILEGGENPYVVFKQKKLDKEAALKEQELQARVQERQETLAAKIIKDIEHERIEAERLNIEKEYEKKQRDELGRHVTEARNRSYLKAKTTKKVDIIDPTGRTMRIDPSQMTTIVDRAFGLGFNPRKDRDQMAQVIEMVTSQEEFQNVGFGEYTRLLPKRLTGSGNQLPSEKSNWLDSFVAPDLDVPGQTLLDQFENAQPENNIDNDEFDVDGDANTRTLSKTTLAERLQAYQRPLTKFEQDCLEKAQTTRRERLEQGVPQVACNKIFKGPAFGAAPTVLEYKDYTLGTTHSRKLVVTNVSHAVNRFKVMDLPDDVRDFFEIKYERAGGMSPGMSCNLEILFTPKIEADIVSALPLLTETGPVSIPIVCTYPKVVPRVLTSKILFEDVVLGESLTLYIKLKNDGALRTRYEIIDAAAPLTYHMNESPYSDDQPVTSSTEVVAGEGTKKIVQNEEPNPEDALMDRVARRQLEWIEKAKEGGDVFRFREQGEIGPYSEVLHAITFAPLKSGSYQFDGIINFSGFKGSTFHLNIKANAVDIPIYIQDPMVDMRCCVLGKLYRADILVKNRGKISYKVVASVPKELRGVVELNPDMGFIQPKSDFQVQMKFRPNHDLVAACGQYAVQRQDGSYIIAVPVQLSIPEQRVPVFFVLRAQLTPGSLSFSSRCLNFGDCNMSEAYKTPLRIKNDSHLAQKVGFIKTPSSVEIKPSDGFVVLLPLEEIELDVVFKPPSAIHYDFNLTLRTSLNMTYKVQVQAEGLVPALNFSSSLIKLGASCPGDVICREVRLINTSKHAQSFELAIPQPATSYLKIAPAIGCIQPDKSQRITIWFSLPEMENNRAIEGSTDNNCNPLVPIDLLPEEGFIEYSLSSIPTMTPEPLLPYESTNSSPQPEEESEPWSRHAHWKIPCYIKSPTSAKAGIESEPQRVIFLEVHTCVLLPRELSISPLNVDFGQLPVGQTKTMAVRVRNLGPEKASLMVVRGLNAVGYFSLVNTVRPIPAATGMKNIFIQFFPPSEGRRTEVLHLKSPSHGKEFFIRLQGEGVKVAIEIDPPDGKLNFGNVLEGRTVTKSFKLKNTSPFSLHFELRQVNEVQENYSHILPFKCSPMEAMVASGETKTVDVSFSADHTSNSAYSQTYQVCVAGQTEKKFLSLEGRVWPRQLYVVTDDSSSNQSKQEDPLAVPAQQLQTSHCEVLSTLGVIKKVDHTIKVKFPKPDITEGGVAVPVLRKSIIIGSASSGSVGGGTSPGTFEIELGEETKKAGIIYVAPEKGPIGPDAKIEVVFTHKPTTSLNKDASSSLVVGQWKQFTAKAHLKGGYRPPGEPETLTVPIIIEAYVYL